VSNNIVFLCQPSTAHDYWTYNILAGIKDEASSQGASTKKICNTKEIINAKNLTYILLIGHSISWFEQMFSLLEKHEITPIVVSAYKTTDEYHSGVFFSMTLAFEQLIEYLISLGKKNIAFVGLNPDSPADVAKSETFVKITKEHGLKNCKLLPCENITMKNCINKLITHIESFDAVMCANDPVAIFVITQLKASGIDFSKNLLITGSGNLRLTETFHMPITSINLDYYKLGIEAAKLFLQKEKSDPRIRQQVFLPCDIVVRKSNQAFEPPEFVENINTDIFLPNEVKLYYQNPEISYCNKIETLLQQCDKWDLEIINGLLKNQTYTELSTNIHFTERAIKYRMKRICELANVQTKRELFELLTRFN